MLKLSQNYPYNIYLSRFGDVKVHKPIQDGFVSGSVEIHGESLRIFDRIVWNKTKEWERLVGRLSSILKRARAPLAKAAQHAISDLEEVQFELHFIK